MKNNITSTFNSTSSTLKLNTQTPGHIILVIFLSILGIGLFGAAVYIARLRTKSKTPLKNRATKYLDNSNEIKDNHLNSKKDSNVLDKRSRSFSNKNKNHLKSKSNIKNDNKKNYKSSLQKNKIPILYGKENDKISIDSQNSVDGNFKIIAIPFKFHEFEKKNKIENIENDFSDYKIDKNLINNKKEKINIFSHYNSLIQVNFKSGKKSKNKNKLSTEVSNNNTVILNNNALNINEFSKIKIYKKIQENNLEGAEDLNFHKKIDSSNVGKINTSDNEKEKNIGDNDMYLVKIEEKENNNNIANQFSNKIQKKENKESVNHIPYNKDSSVQNKYKSKVNFVERKINEPRYENNRKIRVNTISNTSRYSEFEEKVLEIYDEYIDKKQNNPEDFKNRKEDIIKNENSEKKKIENCNLYVNYKGENEENNSEEEDKMKNIINNKEDNIQIFSYDDINSNCDLKSENGGYNLNYLSNEKAKNIL